MTERLKAQIAFIMEIDKAKNIFRRTFNTDCMRRENDAEHMWHLAVMAMVLAEYFEKDMDWLQVLQMVLVHDLVEIYAGDTYCYDEEAKKDKEKRELDSAEKLFSLLPIDQKEKFYSLWQNFEEGQTKESRCANILDRLQPFLLNYESKGLAWMESGIQASQVKERCRRIVEGPEELSRLFQEILAHSVALGYLKED